MKYDLVCGFETHIELSTEKKLFCPCNVKFGSDPNTNCCPICIGAPGTLPVLNKQAVEFAIRMGLALNCSINLTSKMERKCYFYPDLAKAYQISQNDMPICGPGYVELSSGKKIRINHIHIEEDAGKIKNEESGIFVDYNRAGVPLIEIVSEPDISSAEEAKEYIEKLQMIARYVEVSDARMQEGSIRCDVNISIKPEKSQELGTRIEIKNMNSIAYICKALKYEYERQVGCLESGEKLVQETRRFDETNQVTESMRSKESAADYGYFPEPDLLPICLKQSEIDEIKNNLGELPDQKFKRYVEIGIPEKIASLLIKYANVAKFFDNSIKKCDSPISVANMIVGPIFSFLSTETKKEEFSINVTFENLRTLSNLVASHKISAANAQVILKDVLETNADFDNSLDKFLSESSSINLEEICEQCINENPEAVKDFLGGKEKALQAIIGKVMAKTKGRADASEAHDLIVNFIKK